MQSGREERSETLVYTAGTSSGEQSSAQPRSAPAGPSSPSFPPIAHLVARIQSLKALAIETQPANDVLGGLTARAVQAYPDLLPQIQRFGWDGSQFVCTVDLHGKWLELGEHLGSRQTAG